MNRQLRFTLSTKIFLVALLNLLLVSAVLATFMRFQYRFDLRWFLITPAQDRILATARQIALELRDADPTTWDQLLQRYSAANKVELRLVDDDGRPLAGVPSPLPAQVLQNLDRQTHDRSSNTPLLFLGTTDAPDRHWIGVRIPIPAQNEHRHIHGFLIAAASSLLTTPFLFDPKPWIVVACALALISVLCWLPFGRRLVRSVSHISRATSQIAEGQFRIQIPVKRQDELGQLSASINRMASRLDGYVAGQKRFLGDTAHELCSPIARMQIAVSLLERSPDPSLRATIADLRDDLEHMSNLVNDVLSFSKAGLRGPEVGLEAISLVEVAHYVLERESIAAAMIHNNIPAGLYAFGNRDLLDRALSNVVRNAIRYAGSDGPISLSAENRQQQIVLRVADHGPGLPDSDLDRIFDPFYRLDSARGDDSGGVGLGLAIVKSCVEACEGSVACRNLSPHGLAVEITLKAAQPESGVDSLPQPAQNAAC
jgi:signal transduction histidine kinase